MTSLKKLCQESVDIKRRDAYSVPPEKITVETGFNLRIDGTPELQAHIDSIKGAIRSNGIGCIPPLKVQVGHNGAIVVRDGHCRLSAIRSLIAEGLPIEAVPVEEWLGNEVDNLFLVLNTGQGKPLTQFERAVGFKRLHQMGVSPSEIARRIARRPVYIERMLRVVYSHSEIQELCRDGVVSMELAHDLIEEHGDLAALELLQSAQQQAQRAGRQRVMPKNVRCAPRLPSELVKRLGNAVENYYLAVDPELRRLFSRIAERKVGQIDRERFTISGQVLRSLALLYEAGIQLNQVKGRRHAQVARRAAPEPAQPEAQQ
ncbi:ParB/RepB/Spo0J family partition protein [Chitinimonas lacunae]|uniref:ParB/RepB/Spo0J family partition protein n=1 Tax=Chitinimonas lacunae TaxID=1963018 RepID=A0ABV8MRM1_9NEIS